MSSITWDESSGSVAIQSNESDTADAMQGAFTISTTAVLGSLQQQDPKNTAAVFYAMAKEFDVPTPTTISLSTASALILYQEG
jgi:hypothetical protein